MRLVVFGCLFFASLICSGNALHASLGFFGRDYSLADLSSGILAQKEPSQSVAKEKRKSNPFHSRLQLGGDYTYLHLTPQRKAAFNGSLAGAQGMYECWSNFHFYSGVKFNWRQGTVTQHSKHRSIVYMDGQARIGSIIGSKKDGTSWTIFTGFGYHYLKQEQRRFDRKYNEFYIPLGMSMEYAATSWFTFDINVTWMPQVISNVKVNSSKGGHRNLTKRISNFNFGLPFDFMTKGKRFHVIVTPFGEYWQDGAGRSIKKSGRTVKIRSNTYQYWGVDLNLGLCF